MRQLQRQKIVRMLHEHGFPALHGAVEVAVAPSAQRRDMAAFAVVGLTGTGLGRAQAGAHILVDPGLHGLGQQAGLEAVTHDEVRLFLQHRVDHGDGVAPVAEELLVRGFERVDNVSLVSRHWDAAAVRQRHGLSFLFQMRPS